MTNNFAKIFFMPVCSNCGKILDMDVKYREFFDDDFLTGIVPRCCPHCESPFEQIVMPNPTNRSIFHYNKSIYDSYYKVRQGD